VSLGGVIGFDFSSEGAAKGLSVQGGIQTRGLFDFGASLQFWPNVSHLEHHIGIAAVQGVFHPKGRSGWFHPYLLFEVGRYHRFGNGVNHSSQTFGLGFDFPILSRLSARIEGVVLALGGTGGGTTGEIRSGLTYAGRESTGVAVGRHVPTTADLMWIVPVSGPWHPRTPVYAFSIGAPLQPTLDFVTTFGLAYWQIPDSSRSRGYEWDTGSFWVLPSVYWTPLLQVKFAQLVAGPVVTIMFEGPDRGMRGGVHAGPRVGGTAGPLRVSASIEAFWIFRGESDVDRFERHEDQRGILLGIGIGL
jgi:hypothetical protein